LKKIISRTNAFEVALNTDRRYQAEVHINVERKWAARHRLSAAPVDLKQLLGGHLHEALPTIRKRCSGRHDFKGTRSWDGHRFPYVVARSARTAPTGALVGRIR
jgi:hypothetical protein